MQCTWNENNEASGLGGLSSQMVADGCVVLNFTAVMTDEVMYSREWPVSPLLVNGNCMAEPEFQIHSELSH